MSSISVPYGKDNVLPVKKSAGDSQTKSMLIAEIQTFKHSTVTTMFRELTGHKHRGKSKRATFKTIS
jgi:hypothetical protein